MKAMGLGMMSAMMCASMAASAPHDAATRYELRIGSQPLGDALRQLSQKTGVQFARFADLGGPPPVARAVQGRFTVEQALQIMLADSGLRAVHVNDRTIAIVRNPAASSLPLPLDSASAAQPVPPAPPRKPSLIAHSVALALACTSFGAARESCAAESEPDADIEEVVVTGSRVAGTAPVGANVISINRE